MNKNKEKKEKKEIKNIRIQWLFVIIASVLAFFISILGNLVYEFLKHKYSSLLIFSLLLILIFLFVDVLSYLFDRLEEERKTPDKTFVVFLKEYSNYCLERIFSFFK